MIGTFLDAQICVLFTHKGGPLATNLLGLSFSYPLSEGALSAITVAQRLYQFPLGVCISLAVAALPTFSRLATHRDWTGWTGEVTRTLRLAAFVGLVTGFPEAILAILIAVCLGGLVSLILVLGGVKRLRSYIPYGVFLVVGGLAVLVFGGMWGFWGVFFAIPLATLVQAVLKAWAQHRKKGPIEPVAKEPPREETA